MISTSVSTLYLCVPTIRTLFYISVSILLYQHIRLWMYFFPRVVSLQCILIYFLIYGSWLLGVGSFLGEWGVGFWLMWLGAIGAGAFWVYWGWGSLYTHTHRRINLGIKMGWM